MKAHQNLFFTRRPGAVEGALGIRKLLSSALGFLCPNGHGTPGCDLLTVETAVRAVPSIDRVGDPLREWIPPAID